MTHSNEFDVLGGSVADYTKSTATNVLSRYDELNKWFDLRYQNGVDPYSKSTASPVCTDTVCFGRHGDRFAGVNFASQDYLNFSSNQQVIDAALQAVEQYGLHSAGSAALMGNTEAASKLERKIAEFTGYGDCTLFPTGWAAGYGILRCLAKRDDHIFIDSLGHACLLEGAKAATKNVHRFPHLSNESVEKRLRRIRNQDSQAGVLVVTESTFSMDSDVPDLAELQDICHRYDATLIVDCAHDLGCIAEHGGGYLEIQEMVGKVDVLMGSFSKVFSSIGGFVATNRKSLKLGIRYACGPVTFSNAMSPVNCAIVNRCFEIADSPDGFQLRKDLIENARYLREQLGAHGFEVLGKDSAIVPVVLGDCAASRLTTKHAMELGGIVNLVEYPAVARNSSRWRLQVMAKHTTQQIDRMVQTAVQARAHANTELAAG